MSNAPGRVVVVEVSCFLLSSTFFLLVLILQWGLEGSDAEICHLSHSLTHTFSLTHVALVCDHVNVHKQGLYALDERIRELADVTVAIGGGVHLDLVKRIFRDTVSFKANKKDGLLRITDFVFPMYKAYIEPDMKMAHIRIRSRYNPINNINDPIYVCRVCRVVELCLSMVSLPLGAASSPLSC